MQTEKYSFITLDEKVFTLYKESVFYSEFLKKIVTNESFKQEKVGNDFKINCDAMDFEPIAIYLKSGRITENLDINVLSYYCVPFPKSDGYDEDFLKIWLCETWHRRFSSENPYTIQHKITDELLDELPKRCVVTEDIAVLPTRSYFVPNIVQHALQHSSLMKKVKQFLLSMNGKVILAGGAIVCCFFNIPIQDYDFFFIDIKDENEAMEIMKSFNQEFHQQSNFVTKHSWTIVSEGTKFQFVLRNYKNPYELLLGFDLDSCCSYFDGKDFYISDRGLYSWKNHVNTVDWSRLSSTYEYRLVKYSKRGFGVRVPNFDDSKINYGKYFHKYLKKFYVDKITGELILKSIDPLDTDFGTKKFNINASDRFKGIDALLILAMLNEEVFKAIVCCDYQANGNEGDSKSVEHTFILAKNRPLSKVCVYYQKDTWAKFCTNNLNLKDSDVRSVLKAVNISPTLLVQNPGKQITSSFHAIVCEDISAWYEGKIYIVSNDPSSKKRKRY